jgi:hypothetical protein
MPCVCAAGCKRAVGVHYAKLILGNMSSEIERERVGQGIGPMKELRVRCCITVWSIVELE